ncbi:MAG: zf-HC2 domain-containing protein [Planctomycetota bacterium]
MGCGKLEWADALDHALGLLDEGPDARVREHLASCDACRSDSGEFLVLADALRAYGEATSVKGRESFADRTRSEVRNSYGSTRIHGQTAAWRVANTGESQRLRRAQLRRRSNFARALAKVACVALAIAAVMAVLCWFLGATVVDRHFGPVESALGIDLAAWGLRPGLGEIAERAEAAASTDDVRALARPVERLLAREFVSETRTAESVVLLELAHAVALEGAPADATVLAEAIRAADRREGRAPLAEPEALLARKARALWRSGDLQSATEALLLSTLEGSPLADYYRGVIAAAAGNAEAGAEKLEGAAAKLPVVWAELAWRRSRSGETGSARVAVAKAPEGEFKEAVRALVEAASAE